MGGGGQDLAVLGGQLGLLVDGASGGAMQAVTQSWGEATVVNDLMIIVLVVVGRWRGAA